MLALNINCEDLYFKNIKKEDLDSVLSLYNDSCESMFATGKDEDLSFNDIKEKYLETLINNHEFFTGIYLKNIKEIIGVIKGRIDYDDDEKLWISSFLIREKYRSGGIGKKCVNAITTFMKETYDIKNVFIGVIASNVSGQAFWKSIGFKYQRTIKRFMNLNNNYVDFIIMKKTI